MIQCPKCGFEQPPDTYCANCGVNIQRFKKLSSGTHWKKSSWIFYSFLILCVAFGGFLFLQQKQNAKTQSPVTTSELNTSSTNTEPIPSENNAQMENETYENFNNSNESQMAEAPVVNPDSSQDSTGLNPSADTKMANSLSVENTESSSLNAKNEETTKSLSFDIQLISLSQGIFNSYVEQNNIKIDPASHASSKDSDINLNELFSLGQSLWQNEVSAKELEESAEIFMDVMKLQIKLQDTKNIKLDYTYYEPKTQSNQTKSISLTLPEDKRILIYGIPSTKAQSIYLISILIKSEN